MAMERPGEEAPAFLADCMLGRLARWLRILGWDTWYFRAVADSDLLELHGLSGRILLTKDTRLARDAKAGKGLLVSGNGWEEQLRQVMERLQIPILPERILTRCPVCNLPLCETGPEEVRSRVPDHVSQTHGAFRECKLCRRVYWGGTHRDRIRRVIQAIGGPLAEPTVGWDRAEGRGGR